MSTCGALQDPDIKYLPMIDFQFCQICFPIILCSRWFICFLIVLGNQTVQSGMHKSLICGSIILVTSCLQMAESVNQHHQKYFTSPNKSLDFYIHKQGKMFLLFLRFRYFYCLLTWMHHSSTIISHHLYSSSIPNQDKELKIFSLFILHLLKCPPTTRKHLSTNK